MPASRHTDTDYRQSWPDFLRQAAEAARFDQAAERPIIVEATDEEALKSMVEGNPISEVIDNYDEQLAELFISENAHLYREPKEVKAHSIADHLKEHYQDREPWQAGSWVYYPWNGQLLHVLADDLFWRLRTVRNKNLITVDEQHRYSKLRVGCLGLSVGSAGAQAITLSGGSRRLKLADGGIMSGSNLNRVLAGAAAIGLPKSLIISRQLYEMNPYITIERLEGNATADNLEHFLTEPWPLDVVIDEVDDLEIKIRCRLLARQRGLPVLMVSDLGDRIMLDVERFDLDRSLPLFHGLAGDIETILERKDMSQREWQRHATAILGLKNLPLRLQQSVVKIGTEIPTHPQLGGTVMVGGAALAFATRQLAIGGSLKSGRHFIALDDLLEETGSREHRKAHKQHTKMLEDSLKAMS